MVGLSYLWPTITSVTIKKEGYMKIVNLREAALNYAKRGWAVLPLYCPSKNGGCDCGRQSCASLGKHPRTFDGVKSATTNLKVIAEWWNKWPNANIGIATGINSGLVVIDVDGDIGREFLRGKNLPRTIVSKTGRGEHHIFCAPTNQLKNRIGMAPQVDFKGEGGYFVAPPSVHANGTQYSWMAGCGPDEEDLAELPNWLHTLLSGTEPIVFQTIDGFIYEGRRNHHLASAAGTARRGGLSEGTILEATLAENRARCRPPLGESEVRGIVQSILRYPPGKVGGSKSGKDKLLEFRSEFELFRWEDSYYATVNIDEHHENWPIRSSGFKHWLTKRYFDVHGDSPNSNAIDETINAIEAQARFKGKEMPLYVRVAGHNGNVYLDLANKSWEVVEVTPNGWSVISDSPVKFRRPKGMHDLPRPQKGGDINALRRFINVTDEGWTLLTGFLLGTLMPRGPYPCLELHGDQGSGKTGTARTCRQIIDPNRSPVRAAPREERDLLIAGNNSWLVVFDNLSILPSWLSDALCRFATGSGFSTRELYADHEEMIFQLQRPVIFNGIEEIATRGDLLDRAIIIHLPPILDGRRKTEEDLQKDFTAAHPLILGALLNAVSRALRDLPKVKIDKLPRMADFTKWVTAGEPAFGWTAGTFMKAYTNNREEANLLTIEASSIGLPLLNLKPEKGKWQGTASQLLTCLERNNPIESRRTGWPKTAHHLSGQLNRLSTNLRAVGIRISRGSPYKRSIIIDWERKTVASARLASSPLEENRGADDAQDTKIPPRSRLRIFVKRKSSGEKNGSI